MKKITERICNIIPACTPFCEMTCEQKLFIPVKNNWIMVINHNFDIEDWIEQAVEYCKNSHVSFLTCREIYDIFGALTFNKSFDNDIIAHLFNARARIIKIIEERRNS